MRVLRLGVFLLFSCLIALGQQGQPTTPPSDPTTPPTPGNEAAAGSKPTPALDLTPDANGKLSQEQMQQLFRVAADKDLENEKRQRDYTYVERDVQHNLDGK